MISGAHSPRSNAHSSHIFPPGKRHKPTSPPQLGMSTADHWPPESSQFFEAGLIMPAFIPVLTLNAFIFLLLSYRDHPVKVHIGRHSLDNPSMLYSNDSILA